MMTTAQREGPFGREVELRRPAPGGFRRHVRDVYRDPPGEHGQAQRGDAHQDPQLPPSPTSAASDSRWITQTTSPVRASRTWPRMTGPGSRLTGGTLLGDIVLDEPDGQQVEPDERGHEPADQGGNAHGLSSRRTRGPRGTSPVVRRGLAHPSPSLRFWPYPSPYVTDASKR